MTIRFAAIGPGHLHIGHRHLGRRQHTDIAGRAGGDHRFVSKGKGAAQTGAGQLSHFRRFLDDAQERGHSALPKGQALNVTRLAIRAQNLAASGPANEGETT